MSSVTSPNSFTTPSDQELILIGTHANRILDLDQPIAIREFLSADATVFGFFTLYSTWTSAPLTSLDYLTFTYIFAPPNMSVVRQDDPDSFEKAQKKARVLFELFKGRNRSVKEFEIVIEIGDMTVTMDSGNLIEPVFISY
jgi:hypothetical protein